MEHRWGPRRDIDQPVHIWTACGLAAPGRLRNVSTSGGYVVTSLPLNTLTRVKLRIKLADADGDRAKLKTEGYVVRIGPDGFAVEWREFAPPVIRTLMRIARASTITVTSGPGDSELVITPLAAFNSERASHSLGS